MLTLANNFYITSIDKNNYWSESKLHEKTTYNFRYKEYQVELTTAFSIVGYTQEDNIAIINFGYLVDIEKWSNREQRFCDIDDLDSQNGKSTKQYLDSTEARTITLKFIIKRLDNYLKNITPAIIIRGAISNIKANLLRYTKLDELFFQYNYHKVEFDITKADSLYQITVGKKDDDRLIWGYSKKKEHFDKLNDVFKNNN